MPALHTFTVATTMDDETLSRHVRAVACDQTLVVGCLPTLGGRTIVVVALDPDVGDLVLETLDARDDVEQVVVLR